MYAEQYYSYLSGTTCLLKFKSPAFRPYLLVGDDLLIRDVLKTYPIQRILDMLCFCFICNRYVEYHHSCEPSRSIVDNCKQCGSLTKSKHYIDLPTLPKSDVPVSFEACRPFMRRIGTSQWYISRLEGEMSTHGIEIDYPCLSRTLKSTHYNFPAGYYLMFHAFGDASLIYPSSKFICQHSCMYPRKGHTFMKTSKHFSCEDIRPTIPVTATSPIIKEIPISNWLYNIDAATLTASTVVDNHRYHIEYDSKLRIHSLSPLSVPDFPAATYVRDESCFRLEDTVDTVPFMIPQHTPECALVSSMDYSLVFQMDESSTPSTLPSAVETSAPASRSDGIPTIVPMSQLVDVTESASSDQAIDFVGQDVGVGCARQMITVDTPTGPKQAIVLANDNYNKLPVDYLPGVSMPDFSIAWKNILADSSSGTYNVYKPSLSNRVRQVLALFKFYRTNLVWRIIAEPSFFQAQRVWVGFNPTIRGTPQTFTESNQLVGFEWNPSEENEIYVVTPWSSLDNVGLIADFSQLGQLIIDPKTSLITETGLPAPLQYDVYVAPIDLAGYVPVPVSNEASSYISSQRFTSDTATTIIPANALVFVTECSCNTRANLTINGKTLIKVSDTADNEMHIIPASSTENTMIIDLFDPDYVQVVYLSDMPFTGSIEVPHIHSHNITTKVATVSSFENLGSTFDFTASDFGVSTPDEVFLTSVKANSISFEQPDYKNPTTVTSTLSITQWYYAFEDFSLVTPDLVYQMKTMGFNLDYNPSFNLDKITYGSIEDHTTRLDNQFSLVGTYPIADSSDQITIDFLNPDDKFAQFDLRRHFLFSKFPNLKLTGTSNPSSNALLRITQKSVKDTLSKNDILQLPGFCWDIKTGAHNFQPYWCSRHPAEYSTLNFADYPYLQVDVLSGTIGTTFEITLWYNTQPVDYMYYVGQLPSTLENTLRMEPLEYQMAIDPDTQLKSIDADGASSVSERRWNYIDTLTVSSDTSLINIPVNAKLLGKWPTRHIARYSKWRGNLPIKVMVNNSQLINGNIHVFHHNFTPSGALDATKFVALIGDISHSVNGAPGSALTLDLGWRTSVPFLATTPTDDAENGWLAIAIPSISSLNLSGSTQQHVITLYSDTSALEFSLPRSTSETGDYSPITYVTSSRTATSLKTAKKPLRPLSLKLNMDPFDKKF